MRVALPISGYAQDSHTSGAIIYQKQLLYDAALVHLVHVGLIAAFAFDMQNYAQFISAAMRAAFPPITLRALF